MRRYWLRTEGFDGYEVVAASAGAARWRSFSDYDEAGYGHVGVRYEHRSKSQRFRAFLVRTVCHALGPVTDGPLPGHGSPPRDNVKNQESPTPPTTEARR